MNKATKNPDIMNVGKNPTIQLLDKLWRERRIAAIVSAGKLVGFEIKTADK
jgi:hypothetical protein